MSLKKSFLLRYEDDLRQLDRFENVEDWALQAQPIYDCKQRGFISNQ